MIELHNVTAFYGRDRMRVALDDVSLTVPPRETMVLLGASGAGKSTVLRAILKLLALETGHISIDGADIRTLDTLALRRTIGMVFQGIALFPHMTVRENIGLTLRLSGMKKSAIRTRVDELLELIGLPAADYAERYPHMLSGGQQQRVGVARALAPNPAYLLMDEPFGALDAMTRRKLQEELKAIRRKLAITILFVTHDVMEAVSLGDQLAVMDQGRIVQTGPVRQLLEHPASDVVRDLVSQPLRELKTFVKDSVK